MSADHDQRFIRTFLIVLGLLAGIAVVLLIVARVMVDATTPDTPNPVQQARIEKRTQPVFDVVTNPDALKQVSLSSGKQEKSKPMSGKEIFANVCTACHTSGAAGAPKVTNTQEWSKRLSQQGRDKLHQRAIHGYKAMPAKGGDSSLSDAEMKNAVDFILKKSGASKT